MLGLGTILHLLTGINMLWGTIIGAAVILVYTASGGMWAVTLTDIVQVSLIIIGRRIRGSSRGRRRRWRVCRIF